MPTVETPGWRRFTTVRVDWVALGLGGLFIVVIAGSLLLYPQLMASGTESAVSGASTAEQAGGGLAWAIAEALFAGFLLALIFLFRRAPGWVRAVIGRTLPPAFWVVAALYTAATAGGTAALVGVPAAIAIVEAAKQHDVYWMLNNVLGLGIAIVGAAVIGIRFGPVVVGVGLVGLSIYDYWFADRKTWMFDLAEWMLRWKVPVMVIFPPTLRFEWSTFTEFATGDKEQIDAEAETLHGIGVADLLLPAALAVGVATTGGGLPVAGVVVGTLAACFRLSHKMHERSGAGLPALTTGAIGGWGIAVLIVAAGGL